MLPSEKLSINNITWDYFDKAFWLTSANMHTVIELLIKIGEELGAINARLDALEGSINDLWTAVNNAQQNITGLWNGQANIWRDIADIWGDLEEHTKTDEMLFDLIKSYHP